MAPKVSIVIPAYNVEKYIKECLQSVIAQTFTEWEAIVIDDGSTDKTLDVIKTIVDPRLRYLTQTNVGLSATRNQGVQLSNSNYLLFLDSDDCLDSHTLEYCYAIIKTQQVDAVTFDGYDFIEKKSEERILDKGYFDRSSKLVEKKYSGKRFLEEEVFKKAVVVSAPLYLVKKERLQSVPFIEGLLHEDVLFHYQLMPILDSIYYLPKKFYQRRLRQDSIVHTTTTLKSLESYKFIMNDLHEMYVNAKEEDKLLYQKIIEKNMMQVGKLGKRYLLTNNSDKKSLFKILRNILDKGDKKLKLKKYYYFSIGAMYYLFKDL